MRILALDLGQKSLGICISDVSKIIPIPLENYNFEDYSIKEPINRIMSILGDYKIETILIGYPLKLSGDRAGICDYIDKFIETLIPKLPNYIELKKIDERFTTKNGLELIKDSKIKPQDKKKIKDMLSAYIMLQDYINNNNI